MSVHRFRLSLALTASLGLALPATANDDRRIDEDIRLAVGLAKEFQFVDMAVEVLDGLSEVDLSQDQERRVGRAECDVYGEAARYEPDEAKREELFVQAIDQYQKFVDRADDEEGDKAKVDLVNLAAEYGQFMMERLEEAAGDEAGRIREELESRLNKVSFVATEAVVDLKDQFDQLSTLEKNQLYRLMLSQGNLLVILGEVAEGGSSYLDNAAESMEELTFLSGADTGFGLSAYHLIGRVEATRGNAADAVDFYEYVATTLIPNSDERWEEKKADLGEPTVNAIWGYYEREISWLVDGQLAAGRNADAIASGLRYYNLFLREGYTLSPLGHLSLLSVSRALLDTGGFVGGSAAAGELTWYASAEELEAAGIGKRNRTTAPELALEIANRVNTENRGNILQIRAQRLIREVVDSGLEVTPDVLYEAALGSYHGEDYDGALAGFRNVIANLETDADRKLFMPKVQKAMGDAFRRAGRDLEAALAYREGVTTWRGDEEYDPQNAARFYAMMGTLRREMKDVAEVETLFRESEVIQSSIGDSAGGSIDWRRAQREYDAQNWQGCRDICQSIDAQSDYHEKAIVRGAVCLYRDGDLGGAEGELTDYLEVFVEDPRNLLTSQESNKIKLRNESKAEAVYFLGQIDRDRGDWEGLLARYATFPEDFRGQDSLTAATMLYRVEGAIELGQDDLADRLLQRMVDDFPKDPSTGSAATKLYNAYVGRSKEATPGTDESRELKGKMAETLALSNSLKGDPSFSALSTESSFWVDAEEWERADEILTTIRSRFADAEDSKTQESFWRTILPRHGLVQLELKRVAEAYETLAPLVPAWDDKDPERRASVQTVRTYCRAVTGWLEGDADSLTRVPGGGGAEALANAAGWLDKVAKGQEEYSCDWFGTQYERIFALMLLGQEDSSKSSWAGKVLNPMKIEFGATFADVAGACDGDRELQDRYRWLASQIN